MAEKKPTILIVDDELSVRESLKIVLEDDYDVFAYESPLEAFDSLKFNRYDIIFLDIVMPGMTGLEFLKKLREEGRETPVVMITATKDIKIAVQCIKLGACDYVTKPYSVEEILDIAAGCLKETKDREQHLLKKSPRHNFENFYAKMQGMKIIGKDSTLKGIFQLVKKISQTDSTVLITGESGTGKEVIAKAIHFESPRAQKPFIAVHLSAMSEKLIESELFGHVKGSFTGADRDHTGFLELAEEGTLFLDEIGDIPQAIQVKLLRTLQEKEFRKVGSSEMKKVNVRFITATNRNLLEEVQKKSFREDLYYRLNVIPIHLPPLRDRKEDIADFVKYFSDLIFQKLYAEPVPFSQEVMDAFRSYPWPGNVRELQNTVEHMILMNDETEVGMEILPLTLTGCLEKSAPAEKAGTPEGDKPIEETVAKMERDIIVDALSRSRGFITDAAEKLGTTRRILKYKMDKLGIDKESFKSKI